MIRKCRAIISPARPRAGCRPAGCGAQPRRAGGAGGAISVAGRPPRTKGKPDVNGLQRGERGFSSEQAARRALSAIYELELTADLHSYGGDPTVWGCRLLGGKGAAPWGRGHRKGAPATARSWTPYEALKRYVVQQHSVETVELRTCAQIAESALSAEAYAAPLAELPNELIACRIFQQIDGADALAVPPFLYNAWWVEEQAAPLRAQIGDSTDDQRLARYSSNNRFAIGGSFAEATMHAIDEIVYPHQQRLALSN